MGSVCKGSIWPLHSEMRRKARSPRSFAMVKQTTASIPKGAGEGGVRQAHANMPTCLRYLDGVEAQRKEAIDVLAPVQSDCHAGFCRCCRREISHCLRRPLGSSHESPPLHISPLTAFHTRSVPPSQLLGTWTGKRFCQFVLNFFSCLHSCHSFKSSRSLVSSCVDVLPSSCADLEDRCAKQLPRRPSSRSLRASGSAV